MNHRACRLGEDSFPGVSLPRLGCGWRLCTDLSILYNLPLYALSLIFLYGSYIGTRATGIGNAHFHGDHSDFGGESCSEVSGSGLEERDVGRGPARGGRSLPSRWARPSRAREARNQATSWGTGQRGGMEHHPLEVFNQTFPVLQGCPAG